MNDTIFTFSICVRTTSSSRRRCQRRRRTSTSWRLWIRRSRASTWGPTPTPGSQWKPYRTPGTTYRRSLRWVQPIEVATLDNKNVLLSLILLLQFSSA